MDDERLENRVMFTRVLVIAFGIWTSSKKSNLQRLLKACKGYFVIRPTDETIVKQLPHFTKQKDSVSNECGSKSLLSALFLRFQYRISLPQYLRRRDTRSGHFGNVLAHARSGPTDADESSNSSNIAP